MKKNIIILTILVVGFLGYILYSGYNYVNSYYKHEHITGVEIELIPYKPGQDSIIQTMKTTDENEIAEIINLLNDRTVIKLFPDIGRVKSFENDKFEFRIELISSTNLTLEYRIFSSGEVEINKGFVSKFSNTMVFRGSNTKWFNEINALFEENKQDNLWSQRNY